MHVSFKISSIRYLNEGSLNSNDIFGPKRHPACMMLLWSLTGSLYLDSGLWFFPKNRSHLLLLLKYWWWYFATFCSKGKSGNCSGENFHFFYQNETKNFFARRQDSLGLLNDFHSRKTVNVVETLVEYHFFFYSGFFLSFPLFGMGVETITRRRRTRIRVVDIPWASKSENYTGIMAHLTL